MSHLSTDNRCDLVTGLVIAKNEEICIERAIQSLTWMHRVIVLDTGSTDRTVELSERNGATVIEYPYAEFDQSLARNFALEEIGIETPWILILDADEICTPELAAAIDKNVRHCGSNIGLFRLAGKYLFLGRWMKHSMGFPAWHDRLIRIGAGRFFGSIPHEKFVCHKGYEIDYITTPYIHDALVHGVEAWLRKHVWVADRLSATIYKMIQHHEIVDVRLGSQEETRPVKLRVFLHKHKLGYVVPLFYFGYMYFFRKGFLDGKQGFLLCFMFAVFEAMVSVRVAERQFNDVSTDNKLKHAIVWKGTSYEDRLNR